MQINYRCFTNLLNQTALVRPCIEGVRVFRPTNKKVLLVSFVCEDTLILENTHESA